MPVQAPSIDRALAQAGDLIIDVMNRNTLPGLAVGVVAGSELVYAHGFGLADISGGREVTPDTVFRIGSISKTFTAIGLMQLWEQGRFGLDDPVNDYLKAFKVEHPDPSAPPVTFRHLLTHTAGIGEAPSLRTLLNFRNVFGLAAREGETVPPLGEYYGGLLRTEVYPGAKWAYANHGFATLGQLIEDISGQPFESYMLERVFRPLGMNKTDFLRSERVRSQLAAGYQIKKGLLEPVKYMEIAVRAAGSMFSSVNEMAKYVAALLNGGANESGSVLRPDTLAMMMEPHYQIDPRLTAIGLAFWIDRVGDHRVVSHGGGWPGFTSSMAVAPDDGVGIVVFTNATTLLAPHSVALGLLRRILDVPDPATQLPRPGLLERPHVWRELVGSYGPKPGLLTNARIWMMFGGEAEVVVRDHRLAIRALTGPLRKGLPLYQVNGPDALAFETVFEGEAIPVVFQPDATGRIECLCIGGMGPQTLYKRSRFESVKFRAQVALGSAAVAALWAARRCRRREEREHD